MLAAWLGEAWLQRGGLGGLQRALVLLAELCERYPEEVHPQAQDGDQSWRVPPIDWLLRRYAELLHTRLPLMGQGAFAESPSMPGRGCSASRSPAATARAPRRRWKRRNFSRRS